MASPRACETTRTGISHGVLALPENPEQWQEPRRDPSLIPAAVAEILRWAASVLYFRRNALTAMDIGGLARLGRARPAGHLTFRRKRAIMDDSSEAVRQRLVR
jgi:cytochrome P450